MATESFLTDFASAISQIAEEKGIEKNKVIDVVEAALSAAYKKEYGKRGQNIRAEFNEEKGSVKFFLVKEVVDESVRDFSAMEEEADAADSSQLTADSPKKEDESREPVSDGGDDEERLPRFHPERDLTLEEAKELKDEPAVGDIIESELPPQSEFGRVAAQTAKQVIIQRVREAERDAMYEEYKEKEHEVLSGTIQRVEGRTVFVDIGKSTGVLFPSEQIPTENYRVGQRVKVYVVAVASDPKGPGITLSRSHPELVRKLFELEVPEIFSGTVELKSIAREAGSRVKIAVYTEDEGIDPIGSCVGQKGTRVQAVIDELGGEKVDIIEWSEDSEKFIAAALSPAKVVTVSLNEETKTATILVPQDQLSLAIGKRGQNVRLASKLTGWNLDVNGADEEGNAIVEDKSDSEPTTDNQQPTTVKDTSDKTVEDTSDSEPTTDNQQPTIVKDTSDKTVEDTSDKTQVTSDKTQVTSDGEPTTEGDKKENEDNSVDSDSESTTDDQPPKTEDESEGKSVEVSAEEVKEKKESVEEEVKGKA